MIVLLIYPSSNDIANKDSNESVIKLTDSTILANQVYIAKELLDKSLKENETVSIMTNQASIIAFIEYYCKALNHTLFYFTSNTSNHYHSSSREIIHSINPYILDYNEGIY